MRVALDARAWILGATGLHYYTQELARGLTAEGVDVTLWFAARHAAAHRERLTGDLARLGLPADVVASPVGGKLLYPPAALRAWRHWPRWLPPPELLPAGIDVFHTVYWPLPLTRRPWVMTVHDLIGLRHPEWVNAETVVLHTTIAALAPRATRVIVDSEATRRDLLEFSRVDPQRVTVVPLAAAARFAAPVDATARAAVRQRHGLDRPYLLSVGNLEPRKNQTTLIDAYDALTARLGPVCDLVLAGPDDERHAALLGDRLARPRAGRVRCLGYVDAADLPALYAEAAAFAFLSRYEGFGLPPLEAMAAGTPVLAANTTSLPEVVGDAALLVAPLDVPAVAAGLERLLTDSELAARLRTAGRARAAEFTWTATARRTAEVYGAARGG